MHGFQTLFDNKTYALLLYSKINQLVHDLGKLQKIYSFESQVLLLTFLGSDYD